MISQDKVRVKVHHLEVGLDLHTVQILHHGIWYFVV